MPVYYFSVEANSVEEAEDKIATGSFDLVEDVVDIDFVNLADSDVTRGKVCDQEYFDAIDFVLGTNQSHGVEEL